MAEQRIEAPTASDVDDIARALIHADQVCSEILGVGFDGTPSDLTRLQQILDSGVVDREATYTLQALGLAFGKIFVNENPGYDWWMVEDEYGRDPAIRYLRTTLLAYPRTMLSKRVEAGERIDAAELYYGLVTRLKQMTAEGCAQASEE